MPGGICRERQKRGRMQEREGDWIDYREHGDQQIYKESTGEDRDHGNQGIYRRR